MLLPALALSILFLGLWLLSLRLRDVSIVDIAWGPAFAVATWVSWGAAGSEPGRGLWLALLVSLWALRLAGHLAWRNHGKPEDRRYAAMREARPASFWLWSLPAIFGFQALLVWWISLPLQLAQASTAPPALLAIAGFTLFVVGLVFETVGDLQLARFKAKPENQGKVLDSGLWRYTRHPNYFGDCCVWWGLFLIAAEAPGVLWTVLSPITMTVLLLQVSGVALLERDIAERRPAYRDYVRRTSPFIPWWPRSPRMSDSREVTS